MKCLWTVLLFAGAALSQDEPVPVENVEPLGEGAGPDVGLTEYIEAELTRLRDCACNSGKLKKHEFKAVLQECFTQDLTALSPDMIQQSVEQLTEQSFKEFCGSKESKEKSEKSKKSGSKSSSSEEGAKKAEKSGKKQKKPGKDGDKENPSSNKGGVIGGGPVIGGNVSPIMRVPTRKKRGDKAPKESKPVKGKKDTTDGGEDTVIDGESTVIGGNVSPLMRTDNVSRRKRGPKKNKQESENEEPTIDGDVVISGNESPLMRSNARRRRAATTVPPKSTESKSESSDKTESVETSDSKSNETDSGSPAVMAPDVLFSYIKNKLEQLQACACLSAEQVTGDVSKMRKRVGRCLAAELDLVSEDEIHKGLAGITEESFKNFCGNTEV